MHVKGEIMKITLFLLSCSVLFGQGERSNRPQTSPQFQPSALLTMQLPEQDITITIHVSSALATALEKRRRDDFAPVTHADGSTSLDPKQQTLADVIVFDLRSYFAQLLQRYPAPNIKAIQDAAAAAQKAVQDEADKAAAVTRKK